MLGFKSFNAAKSVLAGIELMHMIRKGQSYLADSEEMSFPTNFMLWSKKSVQCENEYTPCQNFDLQFLTRHNPLIQIGYQVKTLLLSLFLTATCIGAAPAGVAAHDNRLQPYVKAMKTALDPVVFVNRKLDKYDLLVFDDGMHSSRDPWLFFEQLVRSPDVANKLKFIFIEVLPVNLQSEIDAWMNGDTDDIAGLLPVFQQAGDFGWAYRSTFDLMLAVRQANRGKPAEHHLRIIAIDMPSHYPSLRTKQDWELTRISGKARDYHMYAVVRSYLDDFKSGKKGLLLTNTRHAYKHIRNTQGQLHWNAGTFFHEHSPGKTYAIRIHNAMLHLSRKWEGKAKSREGLDNIDYSWIRMEEGLWDSAFETAGSIPVAVELAGTPFGAAAYIGNHMLDAAPGQTMSDAFDAVIFMGPLDKYQRSGTSNLYTPYFLAELKRRYEIIYTKEDLTAMLKEAHNANLEEYIAQTFKPRSDIPDPVIIRLPPKDQWRKVP